MHKNGAGVPPLDDGDKTETNEANPSGTQSHAQVSRRDLLLSGAAGLLGGALLPAFLRDAHANESPVAPSPSLAPAAERPRGPGLRPGQPRQDYLPVVVPNGTKLPWKMVNGVKVFHMVAEEVEHELAPGLRTHCWGYNGSVHGPVIEVVEGDHIRVYVTNRLAAPTTVHWHAVLLPNGMDGVGGLNQKTIAPGETYAYEFPIRQHGTGMYHSHHDEMTQMAMGMTGMIVMHPRRPTRKVDRDFVILLHEWRVDVGASRPNPNEMTDFNMLTMNAKAYPGTAPLVAKKGERIRIRIGNLSAMDHHPIHLHGYQFKVVETDGGEIAPAAQWPETTVLVPVGSTRTIEFVANEPGDWAMHCHMTHHVMNQMGHKVPNMIGVQPGKLDAKVQKLLPGYMTMGPTGMGDMGDMGMPVPPNSVPMVGGKGKHDVITMGGMFTIFKVREHLTSYADPGWYDAPAGTMAREATADELQRDAIDVDHPPIALPGEDSAA